MSQSILSHYHHEDLLARLLGAYQQAGMDVGQLTRDQIGGVDEFHIGGRDATRDLARIAGIAGNKQVLDLGSGIGGPARTLAAEFDCRVTGIDLVEEFCRAAQGLTERLGLMGRVSFRQGDITRLPFDDEAFDVVWSQHVNMNVANKPGMIGEAYRVLRPGGTYAMHEICAGEDSPPYYPVPWAGDAGISHLASTADWRNLLQARRFRVVHWADVSAESLKWFESRFGGRSTGPDVSFLMGANAAQKVENVIHNLRERRIAVIRAVALRDREG